MVLQSVLMEWIGPASNSSKFPLSGRRTSSIFQSLCLECPKLLPESSSKWKRGTSWSGFPISLLQFIFSFQPIGSSSSVGRKVMRPNLASRFLGREEWALISFFVALLWNGLFTIFSHHILCNNVLVASSRNTVSFRIFFLVRCWQILNRTCCCWFGVNLASSACLNFDWLDWCQRWGIAVCILGFLGLLLILFFPLVCLNFA